MFIRCLICGIIFCVVGACNYNRNNENYLGQSDIVNEVDSQIGDIMDFSGRWESLGAEGNYDGKGWIEILRDQGNENLYFLKYYHIDNPTGSLSPGIEEGFFVVSGNGNSVLIKGALGDRLVPGDFSSLSDNDWEIRVSIVHQTMYPNEKGALVIMPTDFSGPLVFGTFQRP